MLNISRPAAGVAFAGFLLVFMLLSGSISSQPEAKEPNRTPRVLIPDFPKLFNEGQKKKNGFVNRRGVFRVKLVGYQLSRWNYDYPGDGVCSGNTRGHGFERVVFRSPNKRMRLSAFGKRRLNSMILPRMKVRGQLTRQGKYSYTPHPNPAPDCPYGDGGGPDYEPPASDCGTRKFKGIPMQVFALNGFFQLNSYGKYEDRPRFVNCHAPPVRFPSIIDERTNGKPIQTRFPGGLIFNRKFDRKTGAWSKVIVLAKGAKKRRTFNSADITRLQWKLVFKRLR